MENENSFFLDLQQTNACQENIVIYTVQTFTSNLIEKWEQRILETLETWDKDKPYLALHDLSAEGVALPFTIHVRFDLMNIGVTPTGLDRITEIFSKNPHFKAFVAIALNQSTSGYMGQIYNSLHQDRIPNVIYRLFFDVETALEWLEGICKNEQDSSLSTP